MASIQLTVHHPSGLHARPAAKFVRLAASFPCEIGVRNLTKSSPEVSAKSILGVLTLGVDQGHEIQVVADGESAEKALAAIQDLVDTNFGEAVA